MNAMISWKLINEKIIIAEYFYDLIPYGYKLFHRGAFRFPQLQFLELRRKRMSFGFLCNWLM
jgi:hypothetical protein